MLGIWRLLLALLVVCGHLWRDWWAASFAVFSFYVISGYLMTLILNEKYGFSARGFIAFWRARALRLLPSYWMACLVSLMLIACIAEPALREFNGKMTLPATAHEVLSNITMLFIVHPTGDTPPLALAPEEFATLVPPAWALSIELIFYLALSVFFSRSAIRAGALVAIGAGYTVWAVLGGQEFYYQYFFFMAASLPFGAGALTYFLLRSSLLVALLRPLMNVSASAVLYSSLYILAYLVPSWRGVLFYLCIPATALLMASLMRFRANGAWRSVDALLGDLSYPVYLLHWQVGLLISVTTGFGRETAEVFLLALPAVLLAAALERWVLSGPIDAWRRRGSPPPHLPIADRCGTLPFLRPDGDRTGI